MTRTTPARGSEAVNVPEGWSLLPLEDLCTLVNGRGFKPHEWREEGIPIVRIQNLNGSKIFNYFQGDYESKILLQNGELLFAWSGSRGTSFGPHIWRGDTALLNYHTWKVIHKNGVADKTFLFYCLKNLTSKIEDNAHGASALVHTQKSEMERMVILLPLLLEQTKIAQILSTWDEALENLKALLEQKRRLKKGLMQQLLTGRVRFKEFEARGEAWEEAKLGDIGRVIDPHPTHRAPPEYPGGIPFVGIGDISEYGVLDLSTVRRVNPSVYQDHAKIYIIEKGDFAYGRVASIGKVIMFNDTSQKFVLSPTMALIKLNSGVCKDFVRFAMQEDGLTRRIKGSASGSTRQSMGITKLREVIIPFPPLEEQRKIAFVLSTLDQEISTLEEEKAALEVQKRGLMGLLLTGKVRVEVGGAADALGSAFTALEGEEEDVEAREAFWLEVDEGMAAGPLED